MTPTHPIHPALAPLARGAKAFGRALLTQGVASPDLVAALRTALRGERAWLRPEHRVGDPVRYMRHLLYVDPDDEFVLTAITWLPGQSSPVHGHYVWCAYGVAEGELFEERFRAPGAMLEPIGTTLLRAGDVAELDLGGPVYHRVSNCGANTVVTLHVYGVSAARLTTGINRLFPDA